MHRVLDGDDLADFRAVAGTRISIAAILVAAFVVADIVSTIAFLAWL
jgi:hypothetical protein